MPQTNAQLTANYYTQLWYHLTRSTESAHTILDGFFLALNSDLELALLSAEIKIFECQPCEDALEPALVVSYEDTPLIASRGFLLPFLDAVWRILKIRYVAISSQNPDYPSHYFEFRASTWIELKP